mmetsp:Transcript_109166/g.163287  ORF Transcript_109166/g.163287 Transcript_109166/m.163287 type:complete len:211 (-) Transcript_109166:269-901(-)
MCHHGRRYRCVHQRRLRDHARRFPSQGRHGAQGSPRQELRHLQGAGCAPQHCCQQDRQGACGRKPCQHQLPHRLRVRSQHPQREFLSADAAGPQPGDRTAGDQGERAAGGGAEQHHLGQPLVHAVPRHQPRYHQGQAGQGGDRRRGVVHRGVHPLHPKARRRHYCRAQALISPLCRPGHLGSHARLGARHTPGPLCLHGRLLHRQQVRCR